jgi:predicted ATPase
MHFANSVSSTIGADMSALLDLVPVLERHFPKAGNSNTKVDVTPSEAEERTLRIVQSFLSCVARENRLLVLFIDDLQWSSSAEASVLASLISSFRNNGTESAVRHCLLIIAHRVNELPESMSLKLDASLAKLTGRGSVQNSHAIEIQVGPLPLVSLSQTGHSNE